MGKWRGLAIILALSATATAHAAMYQWRDSQGVTHFTDNVDSIPQRYVNVAKELPSIRVEKKSPPTPSVANPPAMNPPAANAPATAPAATNPPAPPAVTNPAAVNPIFTNGGGDGKQAKQAKKLEENAKLAQELKLLQDALPKKKEELARLRHKWVVRKGRMPSAAELKDLEQKRLKKKITVQDSKDNPYVNRNSLSLAGPARAAYYKKLEEVQKDEARIVQLEQELQ